MLKTHLNDLDEELREKALAAFEHLAQSQRGEPEFLGGGGPIKANPNLRNATGIFVYLTEHVGDITNRIARRDHVRMLYGIEMAEPKVRSALRTLRHSYGVEKEINEQIELARQYHAEQTGEDVPAAKWRADFELAADRYASAHKKLPVYNRAQYLAREAAVAIGLRQYHLATQHLTGLEAMMADDDVWAAEAGTVYVSGDKILTYEIALSLMETKSMRPWMNLIEMVLKLGGSGPSEDSPTKRFLDEFYRETQRHPFLRPQDRLVVYTDDDFVQITCKPDINDRDNSVHIEDIISSTRNKGYATQVMKWLMALADKHGVTLTAWAKAYTRKPARTDGRDDPTALSQKDLVNWYARLGFSKQGRGSSEGQTIVRPPNA